jgi:hypothetical protein
MNLRKFAKGQDCLIRIPNYCSHNPDETVLAHDSGGGMSGKVCDLRGAHACYTCHMIVDGHIKTDYSHDEIRLMFLEGMSRTLEKVAKALNLR